MSDTETTLSPVTFVRDVEPGPVFIAGSKNKLWQTEDGRYLATSWVSSAETLAYESMDNGEPIDPTVYFFTGPGLAATVDGPEPMHEAALEKFGYKVAES